MENKEIVIQGRTVEEARLMAAKLLQAEEGQLRIEVLDEGRRGFLGLFGRPATIRAILESKPTRVYRERDIEPDVDGMAEVKSGVLRVYGPRGRGQAAVIIPTPGVILRVNGVAVSGPRRIREQEEVEVEPLEEVHPAGIEVEVSANGFTASVKVTPQVTVRYELVDQKAQNILQLLTRRYEESAKVITVADVEAALRARGVTFGLDREEILRAVTIADGAARVVARGKPVQEGRDGWVEYLFNSEPVEIVYEDDKNVNYWERYIIPSVTEGEVLAVVHPPVPGIPGRKVTGEPVMPAPVREASLRVKDGVVISDDGRRAIAAVAGRPVLEGYRQPYIKIVKLMVHPCDVDIRSGNLSFGGDLLILGSVKEGMRVSAHGNVTVMGNIAGAVIQAGGRVVCRGRLINSRVRAGGLKSFYNRLAPLLDDLGRRLDELIKETTRIHQYTVDRRKIRSSDLDLNRMITLLIERKKKEIIELANKYAAALDETDLPFPPAVREFALGIKNLAVVLGNRESSIKEELESMLKKKEEIDFLLDSIPEQPGDILCSYAQNCVLDAGGSITLTDAGGYYSTLTAGKQVRVRGVFRGGEISALGNVYIDEAGSPGLTGGKVKIRVAEQAVVNIRKVYPETTIQVGGRSCRFDKEESYVKVFLKDDALKIESLEEGNHHRIVTF
ncbi:MAG TPA: FapA family protein [Syntrophomonadaceae bacterium]|nr:FapA family protein [Syntrophomonadaceae bacterium]